MSPSFQEPWQNSRSAKSAPRKRSNGSGLNLSILNNMDVLRNKLLRELMARNQARILYHLQKITYRM